MPPSAGDACPQAEQHPQADGHFADGDGQSDGRGHVQELAQHPMDGTGPLRPEQLRPDRDGAGVVEELGIGQLLEPCEQEGHPQEQPEGNEHPTDVVGYPGGGCHHGRAVAVSVPGAIPLFTVQSLRAPASTRGGWRAGSPAAA